MPLELYEPKQYGKCQVTLYSTSFKFSAAARDLAGLGDVHWMRVHVDRKDRLVVFEPRPGPVKEQGCLKLGTSRAGHKTLTAKGLIAREQWIQSVARLDVVDRRFELRRYEGDVNGWFIQLKPAFEESVSPSELHRLADDERGIYRYRGGNNGSEVIYIGKGAVKLRFAQEPERKQWGVSKIEYSIVEDEQKALEWEAHWIERFRQENNGRLPRFNRVGGHRGS